jgi:hypothetical protein
MTGTLEQELATGSYIFEQPIFHQVFKGMSKIINETAEIAAPKDHDLSWELDLYQMLRIYPKSTNLFRKNVANFKKAHDIKPSVPLSKKMSWYIRRQAFGEEPSFQGYLEQLRKMNDGLAPEGLMTYKAFKANT